MINTDEIRGCLMEWIVKIVEEGIVLDHDYCLSMREGDCMVITPGNIVAPMLKSSDLVAVDVKYFSYDKDKNPPAPEYGLHAEIYQARKDVSAIIHSKQLSVVTASRAGKRVPPMLDDFAQIAGPDVRVADYVPSVDHHRGARTVIRALRRRSAVFLRNNGGLCLGSSMDEAHAVCQVLEKGCKANIEASFIGGGKKINMVEANFMRLVYLLKYSKAR